MTRDPQYDCFARLGIRKVAVIKLMIIGLTVVIKTVLLAACMHLYMHIWIEEGRTGGEICGERERYGARAKPLKAVKESIMGAQTRQSLEGVRGRVSKSGD